VRARRRRAASLALGAILAASCRSRPGAESALEVVRRVPVPAATQGVAVVDGAFFAVASRTIEKYDYEGRLRARFDAGADARIIHLNGCSVHAGVLYCAHSNYPGVPMQSSI
jgi:hypothetical protein